MKKRNQFIAWTLVLLLVLSSVTASGATSGIVKTTKDSRFQVTLRTVEQHVHQSDLDETEEVHPL